jgi:hypothetical protein
MTLLFQRRAVVRRGAARCRRAATFRPRRRSRLCCSTSRRPAAGSNWRRHEPDAVAADDKRLLSPRDTAWMVLRPESDQQLEAIGASRLADLSMALSTLTSRRAWPRCRAPLQAKGTGPGFVAGGLLRDSRRANIRCQAHRNSQHFAKRCDHKAVQKTRGARVSFADLHT